MVVFTILAKLKGLRGGPLDLFGKSAERRMERELIGEFESLIETLLDSLDAQNVERAAQLAARYQDIRGYGPVKEQSAREVRADVEQALEDLEASRQEAA